MVINNVHLFEATGPNKKSAEKAAAQLFLEKYTQYTQYINQKQEPPTSKNSKLIILVDFDNVPEMAEFEVPPQVYVNICVSKLKATTPAEVDRLQRCQNKGMEVTIIDSSRKNAVDLYIVYKCGSLHNKYGPKGKSILIVSRDKFAETMTDITSNIFSSYGLIDTEKLIKDHLT